MHTHCEICLQLYYNVGGYCHNDITYQNALVTPDATLMEKKQDVCQSDTENSDESKAVDNPGSVRTEPLVWTCIALGKHNA